MLGEIEAALKHRPDAPGLNVSAEITINEADMNALLHHMQRGDQVIIEMRVFYRQVAKYFATSLPATRTVGRSTKKRTVTVEQLLKELKTELESALGVADLQCCAKAICMHGW